MVYGLVWFLKGYPVANAVIIYRGSTSSGVWDTYIWCCSLHQRLMFIP